MYHRGAPDEKEWRHRSTEARRKRKAVSNSPFLFFYSLRASMAPFLHRCMRTRRAEPATRGRLLHFFANHELLATELMALVLLRFPDAPAAFRRGVLQTLRDEQEHTRLYLARMQACGIQFGELPVSGYFWRAVSGMTSPQDYVAGLSLTFEQANLDFARHFAQGFATVGDAETARLLDQIYRDEIGHVAYGLKWFRRWKQPGQSDWEAFCAQLKFPLSPQRAKGVTLNVLCPGPTDTPLFDGFIASSPSGAKIGDAMARAIPLRRIGQPDDYAGMIAFLLSGFFYRKSWWTKILLVIFILTAPLMSSSLKLDLPKSDAAQPTESEGEVVELAITADGKLHWGDLVVSVDELKTKLARVAQRNPGQEVQLRADQAVPYGRVAEVIGLLQAANLSRIAFMTDAPGAAVPTPAQP